jgi:hypothetical protein
MAARSSRLCRWGSWLILNSICERTAARLLDILAEKYPQAYFGGAVALAKSIRWETAEHEADRVMTPEQIMDKLQAQQYLDAQAQMGVTERSRESGAGLARQPL